MTQVAGCESEGAFWVLDISCLVGIVLFSEHYLFSLVWNNSQAELIMAGLLVF
jgi:hypothetical protein